MMCLGKHPAIVKAYAEKESSKGMWTLMESVVYRQDLAMQFEDFSEAYKQHDRARKGELKVADLCLVPVPPVKRARVCSDDMLDAFLLEHITMVTPYNKFISLPGHTSH